MSDFVNIEFVEELDNLLASTEHAKTLLKKLQEGLERVEGYLTRYVVEIFRIQELLKGKIQSTPDYNTAFEAALSRTQFAAPELLKRAIVAATTEAPEYADSSLLQPLLNAADDELIYFFREHRAGRNSSIRTEIRFGLSAGNLEDWAGAVEYVRAQLGSAQNDPMHASRYWQYRVYKRSWPTGSYGETMRMRFEVVGKLAPYWSLLNDGNSGGKMSSSWGGYPYPSNGPTHFIEKAEKDIDEYFFAEFQRAMTVYKGPGRKELEETLKRLNAQYNYFVEFKKRILKRIDEINNQNWESAYFAETGLRQIQVAMENDGKEFDINKAAKAIDEILAGAQKERFELGLPGQRLRIRRTRLFEIIYGG